ncbi:MAG: hypothetical protein C4532_00635 [Candidatus Abyssobacteria bacterium SURF_17]|uniref:Uncharacterized protein n=1 Tax=Candidatus Abyssobacteria bacterium SURF_17 TaxID=2093361 RepID=A0A419F9C5_9BACT|nr:MAG: hypothetical protein C4532_00635 [Candidatus Abyssubacteria bacterium SURF_17]
MTSLDSGDILPTFSEKIKDYPLAINYAACLDRYHAPEWRLRPPACQESDETSKFGNDNSGKGLLLTTVFSCLPIRFFPIFLCKSAFGECVCL